MSNKSDGRPCSMEEFVSKLFIACEDHYDREEAINHWLYGEWDEALAYLEEEED